MWWSGVTVSILIVLLFSFKSNPWSVLLLLYNNLPTLPIFYLVVNTRFSFFFFCLMKLMSLSLALSLTLVSMDTSTAVDVAPDVQTRTDEGPQDRLDPPAGSSLRPREDGTARQIMQLLQEMQNPESQPPPFLGENPCIPFFYRPDENDEVKIMVIWKPLHASLFPALSPSFFFFLIIFYLFAQIRANVMDRMM